MSIVNKAPNNIASIKSIVERIRSGDLTAREIVQDTQNLIAECDGILQAWQTLDWNTVHRNYEDLISKPNWRQLPLAAVPFAVKDIYDTADFVTTYGSNIYKTHRPVADAGLVSILRSLGAVVVGKTVTTEFAFWQAGPTVNPYDPVHTPGGSSSGSAAAVATGMVPLALGSQTAASTIRPASYCGIVGFKPSFGLLPLNGVKPLAPSLDTGGFFTRSIDDLIIVFNAVWSNIMRKTIPLSLVSKTLPELGLSKLTGDWETQVSTDCLDAVEDCFSSGKFKGCKTKKTTTFVDFKRLTDDQAALMASEAPESFKLEWQTSRIELSDHITKLISDGHAISAECKKGLEESKHLKKEFEKRLFGQSDILICPATLDTAPLLKEGTGNPLMSRAFTFLGLPSLSLPYGKAKNGLPVGVQVVARSGNDISLLLFAQKYLTKVS